MLPEFYDRFKKEYQDTLCELKTLFMRKAGEGASVGDLSVFQQRIIDTCTSFENTWLTEDCPITKAFEDICEELYLLSEGDKEASGRIERLLDNAVDLFDRSQDREERKLAIALIEKNEERYLKEWLEYHLLMGADHFYVYDHGSTDGSMEILQPYIAQGIIELFQVEGEYLPTQIRVYNDALKRSGYSSRYLAFIDTDEFLVPMKHDKVTDAIDYIFRSYEDTPFKAVGSCAAGGIGVNWRVYGSSGHQTPAEGLVIEEYHHRGPDDLMINSHIKTICKPLAVKQIVNPHFAIYEPGYWCISEHGSLIPGPFFYDSKGDILRLNHYYVKSEQEYMSRRLNFKRSEAGRQRIQTEEEVKRTNAVEDNVIKRFLPALKEAMYK